VDDRRALPRPELIAIVLVTLLLGFLFTIQVRSQDTVQTYLQGQDNVSLGLLITALSQANNRLVLQRVDVSQQVERLQADLASGSSAAPALQAQLTDLEVLEGRLPVHGPGVQMTIGFKLQAFELEDLGNSLRQLGAEAVQVNGRRVTARTVYADRGSGVAIDGRAVSAPFTVLAIGDPATLLGGAQDLVTQLSPRGSVTLTQLADVDVSATAPQRPAVYSSFGK